MANYQIHITFDGRALTIGGAMEKEVKETFLETAIALWMPDYLDKEPVGIQLKKALEKIEKGDM